MSNILQVLGMPELPPRPKPQKPVTKIVYKTVHKSTYKPIPKKLAKQIKMLESKKAASRKMTKEEKKRISMIFGKCIWAFVFSFIFLVVISAAMY